MGSRRLLGKVHWQAPSVIILSFMAGFAFAIGHHAFYRSLDGKSVDETLMSQQVNIAIGTAFAFLVRATLVLAIGAAYWQIFWGTVLRRQLLISHIDALAGILSSAADFTNLKALLGTQILLALAASSWLVPFASLLPPATLSVHSTNTTKIIGSHVPLLSFNDTSMAMTEIIPYTTLHDLDSDPRNFRVSYVGTSRRLCRQANVIAAQGNIPDHQSSYPNSTYFLKMTAPAVQCRPVSSAVLQPFNDVMNCNVIPTTNASFNASACPHFFAYLSWVPNATSLVPYDFNTSNVFLPRIGEKTGRRYSDYVGSFEGGPATLFVAARAVMQPKLPDHWNVLNCTLFNASYELAFRSDASSRGIVSIAQIEEIGYMPATNLRSTFQYPLTPSDSVNLSYMALMECLGRLLAGSVADDSEYFGYDERTLTYQNVDLTRTLLPFTSELLPLVGMSRSTRPNQDPVAFDTTGYVNWTTIEAPQPGDSLAPYMISLPQEAFAASTFNRSLASGIEKVFQNITLSLFSDPAFLKTSEYPVNISLRHTYNTYTYSERNLLLSYSLALSLALLASIAGCAFILLNGASYSNRFSTILRTTRGPDLDSLIVGTHRDGTDPLPGLLANAYIQLGEDGESSLSDEVSIDLQQNSTMNGEQSATADMLPNDEIGRSSSYNGSVLSIDRRLTTPLEENGG